MRCLHSREVGLYEASNQLLGDKKSATVQWVDASMPDKRNYHIKDYETLKSIEEKCPHSENIATFYPNTLPV